MRDEYKTGESVSCGEPQTKITGTFSFLFFYIKTHVHPPTRRGAHVCSGTLAWRPLVPQERESSLPEETSTIKRDRFCETLLFFLLLLPILQPPRQAGLVASF